MNLERTSDYSWRIPKEGAMRVDGIIYASRELLDDIREDESLTQVMNVATLPGIVGASLAMPDIHWGYGFPIGGVAAFDTDEGVISPGGVGYDINCGVRLLRTEISTQELEPKKSDLLHQLFRDIPTGIGAHQSHLRLNAKEQHDVLEQGAKWAITQGFGHASDLDFIEAGGCLPGADPQADRLPLEALGHLGPQLPSLPIQEEEGAPLGLDRPGRLPHDELQEAIQVGLGVHHLDDVQEDDVLVDLLL